MRVIVHVDMDAFFAAVEQNDHPEWRGRPVIVGAAPDRRGVVAAASYEARAYGVRSGMPSCEAGRRCPHGIFVPPRFERYEEVSASVMQILERFTPLVEPLSIDEAVLDVTGRMYKYTSREAVGQAIQRAVGEELGLSASVGVAPNRFLAKLACELRKPGGLTLCPEDPEEIRRWLAPRPVELLWGVGKVTSEKLAAAGYHTIGDIQQASVAELARLLGSATAEWLVQLARGEDDRPVGEVSEELSISREHTFEVDQTVPSRVEQVLLELAADVGRRLREKGWYARVARIKIRWKPFQTVTRQRQLDWPTCDDFSLCDVARALWRAEPFRRPVRLIGFGASGLTRDAGPELPLDVVESRRRRESLMRVVDALNRRYGEGAVRLGTFVAGALDRSSRGDPEEDARR